MKTKILFFLLLSVSVLHAQYTAIPDSGFEQSLIDQGIDSEGILDGQVLTSDIDTITYLRLPVEIVFLDGIEGFSSLEELDVSESLIYFLDLSQNTALKKLNCSTNMLDEGLDLSNNINLEWLHCAWGFIPELNLENLPNLTFLFCEENQITNLDLSNNPNLEIINCNLNPLTELDITNNSSLTYLTASSTELTTINTSGSPLLEYFACSSGNISSLNLENNINLKLLYCNNNALTELYLNNNSNLERLICKDNDLQSLYIQNGANELLTGTYTTCNDNYYQRFNALNNPNLTCIFVDDAIYSEENWVDYDATSNFVETEAACATVAIEDYSFNKVTISPNPTTGVVSIKTPNNTIKEVIIYNQLGQRVGVYNTHTFNISNLINGVYIAKTLNSANEVFISKIIKE